MKRRYLSIVLIYKSCKVCRVNKNNISNKIHTIAIDDNNYQTLRSLGSFGDSFNNIVTNLLLKTARRKKVEDRQDDIH
jgi:hypothetical protein